MVQLASARFVVLSHNCLSYNIVSAPPSSQLSSHPQIHSLPRLPFSTPKRPPLTLFLLNPNLPQTKRMRIIVNRLIVSRRAHIRFVKDADMRPLLTRTVPPFHGIQMRRSGGESAEMVERFPV